MRKVLLLLSIACCLFALIACDEPYGQQYVSTYTPSLTPISFDAIFENKTTKNNVSVSFSTPVYIGEDYYAFSTYPKSVLLKPNEKAGMKVSYNLVDGEIPGIFTRCSSPLENLEVKNYKRSSPYVELAVWDIRSNCNFTLEEETETIGVTTITKYKLFLEDQ